MDNFKEFRGLLIASLVTLIVSFGGYLFVAQVNIIQRHDEVLRNHGESIARFEVIVQQQKEMNERLEKLIERLSARP